MTPLPCIWYPDDEKPQLLRLRNLFVDWHECFKEAEPSFKKHKADDFVCDGFYPCYFSQRLRILFVGKESRDISGCHNMNELTTSYHTTKKIGERSLNRDRMHARMIYIAYGLLRGIHVWQDIPYATDISGQVGTSNGFSFAFMNVSKLSNEAAHFAADHETISASVHVSSQKRRFNEEEIAILEPHLVVSMNLGDHLKSLGEVEPMGHEGSAEVYWLRSGGHRSLLVNTYHFAAVRGVKDIEDFYQPVCHAVKKHLPRYYL